MKTLKFAFLTVTILFSISCHGNKPLVSATAPESGDSIKGQNMYDYIQLERRGGGDKLFNLYPTQSEDTLKAEVLRYSFKDTSAVLFLTEKTETDSAFATYYEILKGKTIILEDSTSGNKMLTGTWNHYYAVKDSTKTEITRTKIKKILIQFEQMLNEAIAK
jgi:hypothetical protein